MRQILLVGLLALAMVGCATAPYGNFVGEFTNGEQEELAGDAVLQLATLYPPAKTHLMLGQATSDVFGVSLVKQLRDSGYAVEETNAPKAKATAPMSDASTLALRYVLDHAGSPHLYRVTLWVGAQSISRPYLKQSKGIIPAGYWARKE